MADTPLLGFLEQLALVGDADASGAGDRASLMTLHAAKGLEFDAVWLTGLEERVFPNSRALGFSAGGDGTEDVEQLAEERRLCYVGMTRARRRLTLTLARCRSLFGELRFNPPSRFLREIPPALATGLSMLEEAARGSSRSSSYGNSNDYDQRPRYAEEPASRFGDRKSTSPMPARNSARPGTGPARFTGREDPISRPPPRPLPPGAEGLGPGARVRHASFGIGSVEEVDGSGQNLKLTVRFAPGVGLKKVLARFVEKA